MQPELPPPTHQHFGRNCIPINCRLIHAQQCSTGLRSGELGGHFGSKTTPWRRLNAWVEEEVWQEAPSCINTVVSLIRAAVMRWRMKGMIGPTTTRWYASEFWGDSQRTNLLSPLEAIVRCIMIDFECLTHPRVLPWRKRSPSRRQTFTGPSFQTQKRFSSEKRTCIRKKELHVFATPLIT